MTAAPLQSFEIRQPVSASVLIVAGIDHRTLLTLRVDDDGQLAAEYDPADLDEAARRFVDELRRIWRLDV